jgi:hypothetical protein
VVTTSYFDLKDGLIPISLRNHFYLSASPVMRRTPNYEDDLFPEGIRGAHWTVNERFYTHDQYLEYMELKTESERLNIAYTRVSGVAQKPDLANRVKALEQFCIDQTIVVDEWMQDIGSGLNYKRKQFIHLFELIEQGRIKPLSSLIVIDWYALGLNGLKPFMSDMERNLL